MKPYSRPNSVVDSVASAAESIRSQRNACLGLLEQKGVEVSNWIQDTFKAYKTHARATGPSKAAARAVDGNKDESLPADVIAWIDSLKKKELKNELRGRDLNTTGLKDELRGRLIESMVEERRKASTAKHEGTKPSSGESGATKTSTHDKKISPMKGVKRMSDVEMEDPAGTENSSQSASAESMEIDAVSESAMPPPQKIKQVATTSSIDNLIDSESKKMSPPHKVDSERPTNIPQPTSATRSTSRSPLRRMQVGVQSTFKNRMQNTVQSALKNLRPVSPKKPSAEAQKSPLKPKKQIVVIPGAVSTDETESSSNAVSEAGHALTGPTKTLEVPVPGGSRTLTTPGVPLGLSAASKMANLTVNSDSVKAKNDARMARIAEIRSKSKTATSSSTQTNNGLSNYSGLKASVSSSKKPLLPHNKRQNLATQMREKASGRLGEAAAKPNAAPSQTMSSQKKPESLAESTTPTSTEATSSASKPQPKPSTPPPSATSSPLDTYEMSDHGGNSDTDEEEERSRRVGKRVPTWANKENLKRALQHQYTTSTVDPDDLFGEVTTCSLEAIFGDRKKSKYQKRTSSGNWTRDRATVAEKLAFKRQMGYTAKA